MNLFKLQQQRSKAQIILVVVLLFLLIIGAVPGYLRGGNWTWLDLPQVENINQIKNILKTGLLLPDWQIIKQQEVKIGGHKWSAQLMQQPNFKPVMLLLLPQSYYLSKPEVEWMDLNGIERWKTDSYRQLNFTVENNSGSSVKARFFRAWNHQQTFAVIQWYAFPNGGNYSPVRWFWQDKLAQLSDRRVPWVAVCLKIPIEPLGELSNAQSVAESLAQTVQANLEQTVFNN
ncbi:hypothetical protein STA3757_42510 [Stanieria sp. NIES-3757]|nr:hypothetical protein STA3757_42510 [Stanieria sp. NIES-3757]